MGSDKQPLACKVYQISEDLSIQKATVHTIISKFLVHQRESLLCGGVISFLGLVSVCPEPLSGRYRGTLAFTAIKIASQLGIPDCTVLTVLKDFLAGLKDELDCKRSVDIRGIVSLHPLFNVSSGEWTVRSTISPSIRETIKERASRGVNVPISVRVYTARDLVRGAKEWKEEAVI